MGKLTSSACGTLDSKSKPFCFPFVFVQPPYSPLLFISKFQVSVASTSVTHNLHYPASVVGTSLPSHISSCRRLQKKRWQARADRCPSRRTHVSWRAKLP